MTMAATMLVGFGSQSQESADDGTDYQGRMVLVRVTGAVLAVIRLAARIGWLEDRTGVIASVVPTLRQAAWPVAWRGGCTLAALAPVIRAA